RSGHDVAALALDIDARTQLAAWRAGTLVEQMRAAAACCSFDRRRQRSIFALKRRDGLIAAVARVDINRNKLSRANADIRVRPVIPPLLNRCLIGRRVS